MSNNNQTRKLYLDDIRDPRTGGWDVVRSYDEFVRWIEQMGLPDEVSLDHDLSDHTQGEGRERTGYDAAKWLCNYCWENGLPMPRWNVHSANPVGRDNIVHLMSSFERRTGR
jgi:hypothetical protein